MQVAVIGARMFRKHLKYIGCLQYRSAKEYTKAGRCHFSSLMSLSFYRLHKTALLQFNTIDELRLKTHVIASPLYGHYHIRQGNRRDGYMAECQCKDLFDISRKNSTNRLVG